MEIRVLIGLGFCNEDSKLYRFNSIDYRERKNLDPITGYESRIEENSPLCQTDTETTLKSMYEDGWTLNNVTPYKFGGNFLFFLERK